MTGSNCLLQSTIYPIDDVLLPDVVTIPLSTALQAYDSKVDMLAQSVQAEAPAISQLDSDAAAAPLAPTYAQTAAASAATTAAGR